MIFTVEPREKNLHPTACHDVPKYIPEYFMSEKLAVVTGASSGIGFSLAKELASRGYDLVVCSSGERLSRATNAIQPFGTNVIQVTADLSIREGVGLLWKEITNLGRSTLYELMAAGELPFVQIRGRRLLLVDDLTALLRRFRCSASNT